MAMPWFRMYTEAGDDAKLDALTDREFRIWFKLLCLAAEGDERGTVDYIDPEYVAIRLRVGPDELENAIARMTRLRLVERVDDGTIRFRAFEKRQHDKPSDAPAAARERKRRQRSRDVTPMSRDVTPMSRDVTPMSRDVTPMSRQCHAIDTDIDTETDTETDVETSPCHSEHITTPVPPDLLGYFEDKVGRDATESDINSLRVIVKRFGAFATKMAIGQAVVQGEQPDNFALVSTIAKAEAS